MTEMKSIKWQFMRHSHMRSGLRTVNEVGEVHQTGLDAILEQGSRNGISYLRVDGDGLRLVDGFAESQRGGSSLSLHVYDVDGCPPSPRDMVEISDRLRARLPGQLVEARRREVADRLFEDADFGDWTVAATNGWEGDGFGRYARQVFLEHDGQEGPSRMIWFAVEFEDGFSFPLREPEFELPDDPAAAFGYYVNQDERGTFYADVRDAEGETIFEISSDEDGRIDLIEDGFIKTPENPVLQGGEG